MKEKFSVEILYDWRYNNMLYDFNAECYTLGKVSDRQMSLNLNSTDFYMTLKNVENV